MKAELVHRQIWPTREAAARAVFEYIEVFYNRQRIHSPPLTGPRRRASESRPPGLAGTTGHPARPLPVPGSAVHETGTRPVAAWPGRAYIRQRGGSPAIGRKAAGGDRGGKAAYSRLSRTTSVAIAVTQKSLSREPATKANSGFNSGGPPWILRTHFVRERRSRDTG